ncbi:MAG: phosphatase PAP2 family protein [Candidatus Glassbacteria bacterium]
MNLMRNPHRVESGKKWEITSFSLASFIAWSRLNMDAHYISDVAFGATIGYLIGRTVTRTLDERVSERNFIWFPSASQGRYGLVTSYGW